MKDDDLIAPSRSQTYDIPIITSDAVPLSLLRETLGRLGCLTMSIETNFLLVTRIGKSICDASAQ